MKVEKNERGFKGIEFDDIYENKCSLKESSLATVGAVWFGIEESGPGFTEPNKHMHISQKLMKELLPVLSYFVETGYLPKSMAEIKQDIFKTKASKAVQVRLLKDIEELLDKYKGDDENVIVARGALKVRIQEMKL